MTGTGPTVPGMGWQAVEAKAASHMRDLALHSGHRNVSQADAFTQWPPCPGAAGVGGSYAGQEGKRKVPESIFAAMFKPSLATDPWVQGKY